MFANFKIHRTLLVIPIFIVSFVFASFISPSAKASDTDILYKIDYNLLDRQKAEIIYKIDLKHNKEGSSVSGFSLTVNEVNIEDFKVVSDFGATGSFTKGDNTSVLNIAFPQDKRVRAGNSVSFSIVYKTVDVLKNRGEITDLIIPGFKKTEGLEDSKLTIIIPATYPKINYISNPNHTKKEDKGITSVVYEKMPNSGVVLSFGDHQNYSFNFNYKISNTTNNDSQIASITIPFENENQKLLIDEIVPNPYKSFEDFDGNYVLEFLIEPKEEITVVIKGYVVLRKIDGIEKIRLSGDQKKYYTSNIKYYDISLDLLDSKAKSEIDNKPTDYEKAKAIYKLVIDTLNYSEEELKKNDRKRLGASEALTNPNNAICQEYADLFVGIARNYKIPSRVVAGYAYPTLGYDLPPNTLHAWAQFFDEDKGLWVDVDPTWEDTSKGFDYFGNVGYNHLPIAIYGYSSENPSLVLSFTPGGNNFDSFIIEPKKDSDIKISNFDDNTNLKTIDLQLPESSISGMPINANIILNNNTKFTFRDIDIQIDNNKIDINNDYSKLILLSKTNMSIPIDLKERNILFNGDRVFKIEMTANRETNNSIDVESNSKMKLNSPILSGPIFWSIIIILSMSTIIVIFSKLFHRKNSS